MSQSTSLFLLACLLSACVPVSENYHELERRVVDTAAAQSIVIQVDHGDLTVSESKDSHLTVDGRVLSNSQLEYSIDTVEGQISIKVLAEQMSSGMAPLHVKIQLPDQKNVKIETDDASVKVQGFRGDLEVDSTAGDVTIEQLTGTLRLNSNRGKIKVRESSGNIQVVGNYGAINIQNVSGETAASTIMGDVMLSGLIQKGDAVRLETDHGAITVNLSADSALALQADSTSGDVTCLLPEVVSSTRTCSGEMNSGGGDLSIRTVSGAVSLQLIP